MSYRPFRNIGRFAAGCMCGQPWSHEPECADAPSTTAPGEANPSRVDVFMGYSYFGAHGQVKPANIRYSSIDEGAILSGAYYFNKYVGGEVVFDVPSGWPERWPVHRCPPVRSSVRRCRTSRCLRTAWWAAAAWADRTARIPRDPGARALSLGTRPWRLAAAWTTICRSSTTASVFACSRLITATSTQTSARTTAFRPAAFWVAART